jgi:hypothetical protein
MIFLPTASPIQTISCACDQGGWCVGATPAARNAGQTQAADGGRDVRCAGQVMVSRLQSEQHPDQQQRRAGGPSLRGAGRRVFHRKLRQRTGIAGEDFR